MSNLRRIGVLLLLFISATAFSQSPPDLGYDYPAGGKQGTTITVAIGGQNTRGAKEVFISGTGITAAIVGSSAYRNNFNKEQRQTLKRIITMARDRRYKILNGEEVEPLPDPILSEEEVSEIGEGKQGRRDVMNVVNNPMWAGLDNKTLRELAHISSIFQFPRKKTQINRQLSQVVELKLTIDSEAKAGPREIRLSSKQGISNPIIFQVGRLPEVRETEPNNQKAFEDYRKFIYVIGRGKKKNKNNKVDHTPEADKPLALPVTINGQIMPGDVDRFRFKVDKKQRIVIATEARSLIPYLADAVPGWFQAVITLYDSNGKKIAYADDYQFKPDPVLFFNIPEAGEYEIEIRDSIYRGRRDFVYRIAVGNLPYITNIFPLGGEQNKKSIVTANGFNMKSVRVKLNTDLAPGSVYHKSLSKGKITTNTFAYTVDTLPSIMEKEPNNDPASAQFVKLSSIADGRIETAGDIDVYKFKGKKGQVIALEIMARRLNTPLDSVLKLTDEAGKVIAINDDYVLKDKHLHKDITGITTHHADSYITTTLPESGIYFVSVSDSRRHGAKDYAYRLRISPKKPSFDLRVTPSSLTLQRGAITPIEVHALRKDGYKGPIDISFEDDSHGLSIQAGRIPAEANSARMMIQAPDKATPEPFKPKLIGKATINRKTVKRPVLPADNTMQAFLFRHLLPAQEFMVVVPKRKWATKPMKLLEKTPIDFNETLVDVQIEVWKGRVKGDRKIGYELVDPPQGITLKSFIHEDRTLTLTFEVNKELFTPGYHDTLIVQSYHKFKNKKGKMSRWNSGFLPAIPFVVE